MVCLPAPDWISRWPNVWWPEAEPLWIWSVSQIQVNVKYIPSICESRGLAGIANSHYAFSPTADLRSKRKTVCLQTSSMRVVWQVPPNLQCKNNSFASTVIEIQWLLSSSIGARSLKWAVCDRNAPKWCSFVQSKLERKSSSTKFTWEENVR